MGSRHLQEPHLSHQEAVNGPRVPTIDCGSHIPRVIYQTYPIKTLPEVLVKNIDYIKRMNPSYNHILFDTSAMEQFVREEYGRDILEYYNRINPKYGVARADLFRYLLIYKHGGVYLDVKSRMLDPLASIIREDDRIILSKWRDANLAPHPELAHIPGSEFQNWHIMAVKGHPFLKAVIEAVLVNIHNYRPWRHGVGKNAVLRVTGPIAYTLAIHPIIDSHPRRIVGSEQDISLEYSIAVDGSHTSLFVSHYSLLEESVVKLTGSASYLEKIYFFLRIHLLLRALKRLVHQAKPDSNS